MLLAAVLAAGICTALLPLLVPALQRRAVLDHPGDRSSHTVPTPRGGGLAVATALCAAALVVEPGASTAIFAGAVLLTAGIGLLEDLRGVPIAQRLAVHLIAGTLLATLLIDGLSPVAAVLVVLAVAVAAAAVVNAVNFMDGINGISAATGLAAGTAYAVTGAVLNDRPLAVVGAAVAAACVAFAPWNVPRARVFLGDVGSYGLGAALAGCAVLAVRAGAPPEAVVAPLTLYLGDTGTVILGRLRRRESLGQPHRLHAYQRLTDTGLSHPTVSGIVLGVTALLCVLGLVSLTGPAPALRVAAGAAATAVLTAYLLLPRRSTNLRAP